MRNDTSAIIPAEIFSDVEWLALAGFLAGYSGLTRDAYALDLRQFASWCSDHGLRLFGVRRADIECFGRDLEAKGRAGPPWPGGSAPSPASTATQNRKGSSTIRPAPTSAVPASTTSPERWAWTATNSERCWWRPGSAAPAITP